MLRSFLAIAGNAFTESTRQPVHGATLLAGLGFLALNPALSAFTFGEDATFLVDLGLSTLFVMGLVLTAFTASAVLSGEIERRTVLVVLTKPVSRTSFVLAKFTGIALAVLLACTCWSAALFLSLRLIDTGAGHAQHRHGELELWGPATVLALVAFAVAAAVATRAHFRHGRSFTARLSGGLAVALPLAWAASLFVDNHWGLQWPAILAGAGNGPGGQVALAVVLVVEGLLVLTAIAVACATRLGQTATLGVCASTFLLGLSSEALLGPQATQHPLARLLRHGVPDLQVFWLADALAQGERVPPEYLAEATTYTVLYGAAVLAVAVASFHTREAT